MRGMWVRGMVLDNQYFVLSDGDVDYSDGGRLVGDMYRVNGDVGHQLYGVEGLP